MPIFHQPMALLFATHTSPDASSGVWLYLGAALFFYLGVKYVLSGIKTYAESQTLARAPIVAVNCVKPGLVHVRGKATGDNRLTSPLTKVPCYYYQIQIEKHVSRLKGGSGWTVVLKETEQREFHLDDGTAAVLVNPKSAEYSIPVTFRFRTGRPSSFYIHPALGVSGPSAQDVRAMAESRWGPGKYQLSESCLAADRDCNILGNYAENPNDASNHTLILKGQPNQPFLISSESEAEEEKTLRKKAVTEIATGVVSIALALLCGLMGAGLFFPI